MQEQVGASLHAAIRCSISKRFGSASALLMSVKRWASIFDSRAITLMLSAGLAPAGPRGLQREKIVQNRFVDRVHLRLQRIEKLVQARRENRLYLRVVQLRSQTSQALLTRAGKRAGAHPGDRVHRGIGHSDAVAHRAREFAIQQEE